MTDGRKEWMVGLPDQPDLLSLGDLHHLIREGQVRGTDLVRRTGETWNAAGDCSELAEMFSGSEDPRRKTRRRPLKDLQASVPVPMPVPVLPVIPPRPEGAMEGKYYSPTDLLRAISHGMAPRNLVFSVLLLIPILVAAFLLREILNPLAFFDIFVISLVIGLGVLLVMLVLAHVTRAQVEGGEKRIGRAVGWALRRWTAFLFLPLVVLVPATFFYGILFLLGEVGASSQAGSGAIRILYFVPVLAGLCLVGCFLWLEILLIMVPSCMVIENVSLGKAFRNVRYFLKTQPGRVLLHWLVITAACSMAYRIISYLVSKGFEFAAAMTGNLLAEGSVLTAVYSGTREGLALAIPVSLFVTMSFLSFLVLREEEMEYFPVGEGGEPDETDPSSLG